MNSTHIIFAIIVVAGMLLSVQLRKLTIAAALMGGILSTLIYITCGVAGVILMAAFFIMGVLVTSWKMELKQQAGLAEKDKGRRKSGQVFANAGAAIIIGMLSLLFPKSHLNTPLLVAACFAAATADTFSSELGNVYGKRFFHILSFQPAKKGGNGIISREGTLWGIVGSTLIALIYGIFYGVSFDLLIIIIAGTAGNIMDSLLGAAYEDKGYLTNNMVNFLNTVTAVLIATLLQRL